MTITPTPRGSQAPIAIGARRYLGSKTRLLPQLLKLVKGEIGPVRSVADVFAGTGVVASTLGAEVPTLASDLLYCNHLMLKAFLSEDANHLGELTERITYLNALSPKAGYAQETFGGRYFSMASAGRIDAIRETIQGWTSGKEIGPYGEAFLIASLLYAADRIANTCGHYDAFRRQKPERDNLLLRPPLVNPDANAGNVILQGDANAVVRKMSCDLLYLDPPYNSRQYSDTYHVLENLARWEKPEVHGVARKMDRAQMKSAYCQRDAEAALADLIHHADARYILLSYNNMGTRGDVRSQAGIRDEAIWAALESRGPTEVHTFDFPAFNAGLADHGESHAERVFLCRVKTKPQGAPKDRIHMKGTGLE